MLLSETAGFVTRIMITDRADETNPGRRRWELGVGREHPYRTEKSRRFLVSSEPFYYVQTADPQYGSLHSSIRLSGELAFENQKISIATRYVEPVSQYRWL